MVTHPTTTPTTPVTPSRNLTGEEKHLYDNLVRIAAWKINGPENTNQTRWITNPTHQSTGFTAWHTAFLTGLTAIYFGVAACNTNHTTLGYFLLAIGLIASGYTSNHAWEQFQQGQTTGTGSRLVVPLAVANAYRAMRAMRNDLTQVTVPEPVTNHLNAATEHMNRLVVQAHLLHTKGLSNHPVGETVRTETVTLAAETSALIDVLLGNPDDRVETLAWKQTSEVLAHHPNEDTETVAVTTAFDTYNRALAQKQH